jgi:uncharacterized protein involved in cysteine biosynthesis
MANGLVRSISVRKEKITNGAILGGLLGAAILWGDKIRGPIVSFLENNVPDSLSFLGSLTIPIIIIGGFMLIGYLVDKY